MFTTFGVTPFHQQFPVCFWDIYGEQGHPLRTTISEMGPLLLSRLLNLNDIQSGAFAEDWIEENHNDRPRFNSYRSSDVNHRIEQVGKELRRMMPFVGPREVVPGQGGS